MKKIGLFDSGVGGLTCLKALLQNYPQHEYIYLGDTARLPYGTKSQETIKRYAQQNIAFLKNQGVDLVISACHSASSALLNFGLTDEIPLFEVITPALKAVAPSTEVLGLIATSSTVESGIYRDKLAQALPQCKLVEKPCPLLVPLVESGWVDDPITDSILERYLAPLKEQKIQGLILGCTHFPVLKEAIGKILGPDIPLIDPAQALCASLAELLGTPSSGESSSPQKLTAFVTDDSPHFIALAKTLLPANLQVDIKPCSL